MNMPADGDVVFVPARPVRIDGEREPAIEVRRLAATGERVGVAFSSLRALVATMGPYQPWVSLPMYGYVAWLRAQGVDRVHVDPEYATDVREWSADDLAVAASDR